MKEKVLALLIARQGEFLSGEELSRRLEVSRAAVWKAIESLRADGYRIEAVTRRGYRLLESPDRLSAGLILPLLDDPRPDQLFCLDSVDSTNTYAKTLAASGAPAGTAVIADRQTGGRGRRGRSFYSPAGQGLYLSLLYRPQSDPARAVNLTAYAAVAVCLAIEKVSGLKPGIKWPNDIITDGKKLCGILTEMSIEAETRLTDYVVIGIGINVNQKPEDFPEEIRDVAAGLAFASGRSISRAALAAAVINETDKAFACWESSGKAVYEQYCSRCLNIGRKIKLVRGQTETEAYAEGVDEDFRLLVRYPDGTHEAVGAGEVSVRGVYGYS